MPRGEFALKYKQIFKDLKAAGLFAGIHEIFPNATLFPDAEWMKTFPQLEDKKLAGWWQGKFADMMGLLPQAKKRQAEDRSGEIISLLDQINKRVLVESGKMQEPEALPTLRELTDRI